MKFDIRPFVYKSVMDIWFQRICTTIGLKQMARPFASYLTDDILLSSVEIGTAFGSIFLILLWFRSLLCPSAIPYRISRN